MAPRLHPSWLALPRPRCGEALSEGALGIRHERATMKAGPEGNHHWRRGRDRPALEVAPGDVPRQGEVRPAGGGRKCGSRAARAVPCIRPGALDAFRRLLRPHLGRKVRQGEGARALEAGFRFLRIKPDEPRSLAPLGTTDYAAVRMARRERTANRLMDAPSRSPARFTPYKCHRPIPARSFTDARPPPERPGRLGVRSR
jgi:hypothetical protein